MNFNNIISKVAFSFVISISIVACSNTTSNGGAGGSSFVEDGGDDITTTTTQNGSSEDSGGGGNAQQDGAVCANGAAEYVAPEACESGAACNANSAPCWANLEDGGGRCYFMCACVDGELVCNEQDCLDSNWPIGCSPGVCTASCMVTPSAGENEASCSTRCDCIDGEFDCKRSCSGLPEGADYKADAECVDGNTCYEDCAYECSSNSEDSVIGCTSNCSCEENGKLSCSTTCSN